MKRLLLITLIVWAYSAHVFGVDYSNISNWYECGGAKSEKIDVFYMLPTCVGPWQDANGTTHYNADVANAKHRKAWSLSCSLAKEIFGNNTNFFLPYYRQFTFGAPFGSSEIDSIKAIARTDAVNAFNHYLKHHNNGRRFILAGFSQGAGLLVDIIKQMDKKTYKRMIAAYAVGGCVTNDDLKHPFIKPAKSATDKGVVICFNSWDKSDGIAARNNLFPDNVLCINPINWTTSKRKAVLHHRDTQILPHDKNFSYGTAVVPLDNNCNVTVEVDPESHLLMVSGINPGIYHLPSMASYFPVGSLHLQELFFFKPFLQQNIIVRSR